MSNSPLIRTAVNLCLITAMVIQPVAIAFAQGICSQGQCDQTATLCGGCQCCEVESDAERCGCCGGAPDDADDVCGTRTAEPEESDSFRKITGVASESSDSDETDGEQRADGSSAVTFCLCGIRSEPIAPTPHRVPAPQSRDLVLIDCLDDGAIGRGRSIRPYCVASLLPITSLAPHFSQRFLCVWRI